MTDHIRELHTPMYEWAQSWLTDFDAEMLAHGCKQVRESYERDGWATAELPCETGDARHCTRVVRSRLVECDGP